MAVLCISRQFGAGGRTLAGKIAKRLGYEFADTELTRRVTEATGVSDEWLKISDRERDRGKSFVSSFFSSAFFERIADESSSARQENQVLEIFEQLIRELAQKDKVVFLGRGSQFILDNRTDTIKILLVAPLDWRIDFMMSHHNLSPTEAQDMVRDWDRNRKLFLKKITHRDPDDPSLYDLTLNMHLIRMAWGEKMICDLVAKREKSPS